MQLILPVLLFVFLLSKNVAMEVESIDADVVTIESAPVIESAPAIETAPAPKHQPFNVDKAAILLEHMKMVSSEIFEEHVSIESIEELSTSAIPTAEPTSVPSSRPTGEPTVKPSSEPTSKPSSKPSATPTSRPTSEPTSVPSSAPTSRPTSAPSSIPSSIPTSAPSCQPSSQPTSVPSSQPSSVPSVQPSTVPSGQPTGEPTRPSFQPTFTPYAPSAFPTYQSTDVVTVSALYVLTTVNGAQLDSESEETITQTINELAPKPSTVNVKSISRIIARKLIGHGRRLATGFTYECDVDYSFNLINYPGYNATTLAAVKSSYIELIGTNGTFQSTLRQNAQENTATQLYSTTVASVDVESTIIPAPSFAPTKGPGKTRTARLTDGQIAGLVIGLVVGTGCLFGLLYYYVVAKRASTSYDYPGTNYQQSAGTVLQRGNFDDTVTINIEDRDVVTKAQTISL